MTKPTTLQHPEQILIQAEPGCLVDTNPVLAVRGVIGVGSAADRDDLIGPFLWEPVLAYWIGQEHLPIPLTISGLISDSADAWALKTPDGRIYNNLIQYDAHFEKHWCSVESFETERAYAGWLMKRMEWVSRNKEKDWEHKRLSARGGHFDYPGSKHRNKHTAEAIPRQGTAAPQAKAGESGAGAASDD